MSGRAVAEFLSLPRLVATMVLIIAAGVGYIIMSSPMVYSESGTVVFAVTNDLARSNASASFGQSLIATETMMTQSVLSGPERSQVRDAGGTAQFSLVPFNAYNLEYPDYAEPLATLTTQAPSLVSARRTFTAVLRVLAQRLAALQARAGVAPRDRILTYLTADTGAMAEPGSRVRSFAGLMLIALVAVGMVSAFLGRRRGRGRPGAARPGDPSRRVSVRVSAMCDF